MDASNVFTQSATTGTTTEAARAPTSLAVLTVPDIQLSKRPLEVIESDISSKMETFTQNYIEVGGLLNEARNHLG